MAKGKSFDAILADAETLIRVWTANPKLSLGDVTLPAVEAMVVSSKLRVQMPMIYERS